MKKNIWIGAGAVLLLVGIIVVGQKKAQSASGTPSAESDHDEALASTLVAETVEQTFQSAQRQGGQTGKSAPQELSDAVKALIGEDGKKHNYSSLLAEINTLSYEIAPDDLTALMDMLNFSNDQFPEGMRPIEINAVKNDVLDKLLRQEQLPEGLGLQMVEMAGNADNDPVWRDYCIQFCPSAWERIDAEYRTSNREQVTPKDATGGLTSSSTADSGDAVPPQAELIAIHDAMFQALEERDSTIAGTSLIGLELLSRTHDEFDREMIVSKAAEIASDEGASPASRMTALRLSAQISNKEQGISNDEVSNAARSLAQTGQTVLLRSAAIVTLGEVGSVDDRELLESYLLADNRQIAGAAKMALDKMDAR